MNVSSLLDELRALIATGDDKAALETVDQLEAVIDAGLNQRIAELRRHVKELASSGADILDAFIYGIVLGIGGRDEEKT